MILNITWARAFIHQEHAMRQEPNAAVLPQLPTRRQVATGMAMGCCGMAAWSAAFAQQSMKQMPGTVTTQHRTSLHEDIDIRSNPQRIYDALLDAKQFAAFSGAPAEIDPKAGGAFSMFGGQIAGRISSSYPTNGSCRHGVPPIGTRASTPLLNLYSNPRPQEPLWLWTTRGSRKASSTT
jgi:hypothetical protein